MAQTEWCYLFQHWWIEIWPLWWAWLLWSTRRSWFQLLTTRRLALRTFKRFLTSILQLDCGGFRVVYLVSRGWLRRLGSFDELWLSKGAQSRPEYMKYKLEYTEFLKYASSNRSCRSSKRIFLCKRLLKSMRRGIRATKFKVILSSKLQFYILRVGLLLFPCQLWVQIEE